MSHTPSAEFDSTTEHRRRANPRSKRTQSTRLRTRSTKRWTTCPYHQLEGRRRGVTGARNLAAVSKHPAPGVSPVSSGRRGEGPLGSFFLVRCAKISIYKAIGRYVWYIRLSLHLLELLHCFSTTSHSGKQSDLIPCIKEC
jgi:hypothetical protein